MKLKIKIKRINKDIKLPMVIEKGEWIDLRAAKNVTLHAPQAETLKRCRVDGVNMNCRNVKFDSRLIGLGIAVKLPKGFEAVLLPRSSTYGNFGIILGNNEGIIDNSFCGDNDEWKLNVVAFRNSTINKGDRICQFRIQLSQKATVWQKLKWLLCSGIKIVEVDKLCSPDREGIGSTGIK